MEDVAASREDDDLVVAVVADLGERAREVAVCLAGEDDRAAIGM